MLNDRDLREPNNEKPAFGLKGRLRIGANLFKRMADSSESKEMAAEALVGGFLVGLATQSVEGAAIGAFGGIGIGSLIRRYTTEPD